MLAWHPKLAFHLETVSMFDLTQVRCFVAVAEELHFGRAATRLHMTQPPLSRHIQNLEHRVGVSLLKRTSRTVSLTPAGRGFLAEARSLLKIAEHASLVARRVASGKSGSIRVGYTAASAYGFLPTLVTACRREIPDMDLSLFEMVTGEQYLALTANQIDIGFLRPPVKRAELASQLVSRENLLAAIPSRHPLARRSRIDLADLTDEPFIMYDAHESRYFFDLVTSLLVGAQARPRYVQHIAQIHSMMSLVRSGLGLALVPEAAASLRFKGVSTRPVRMGLRQPVELHMTWRTDNDNPLIASLRGLLAGFPLGK